jgi:hypothetical protein
LPKGLFAEMRFSRKKISLNKGFAERDSAEMMFSRSVILSFASSAGILKGVNRDDIVGGTCDARGKSCRNSSRRHAPDLIVTAKLVEAQDGDNGLKRGLTVIAESYWNLLKCILVTYHNTIYYINISVT